MLGQALEMKSNVEVRRAGNTFGTIVWQLNEIWPTVGWGSIEYGTPTEPGQVVGGRWKPLHHFYEQSMFVDIMATCGSLATCYVKNDSPYPVSGTVKTQLIHFSTGQSTPLNSVKVSLAAGAGITSWFCASSSSNWPNCAAWNSVLSNAGCASNGNDCILTVTVNNDNGDAISNNLVALSIPGDMKLPAAQVFASIGSIHRDGSISIILSSNAVAMYVTLTTNAAGRFSENVFLMLPGQAEVRFIPFGPLNIQLLGSTLTIEHVKLYQQQ